MTSSNCTGDSVATDATTRLSDGEPQLGHERFAVTRAGLSELLGGKPLELPILPSAAAKLMQMSNDPGCDPHALAECIRRDQAIATNLLRLANSAMYSSGSQIVSLQQAVARLGLRKVREIVMIISCRSRVFDAPGFEEEIQRSFRHSLGAAAYAQEIARICRTNVEEAFLSGLLHDVGMPVILQAIIDTHKDNATTIDHQRTIDLATAYRFLVGSDLIEAWKLPQRVAEAIGQQADLSDDGSSVSGLAHIVRLATELANLVLEHDVADEQACNDVRTHASIVNLNLYPKDVDALLDRHGEIRQWVEGAQ